MTSYKKKEMGTYFSSEKQEFVEPLAYGFEENDGIREFSEVEVGVEKKSGIPCRHCTKNLVRQLCITKRALIHYLDSLEDKKRCVWIYESCQEEIANATANLDWVSKKHAESTSDHDPAPIHLRRQLQAAHRRHKIAVQMRDHAVSRMERKSMAPVNLAIIYRESEDRSTKAREIYENCTVRRGFLGSTCALKVNG